MCPVAASSLMPGGRATPLFLAGDEILGIAGLPEGHVRDKTGVLQLLDAAAVSVFNIEDDISYSVQSIPADYLGMAEPGRILPLNEDEQFSHARIIRRSANRGKASLQ